MSNLSPHSPQELPGLALRHTNVSNPSIIEHKPSLQSVTASEDYYSLSNSGSGSGSSTYSGESLRQAARSTNTIQRFQTPPSRYRTPAQSRTHLAELGDGSEERLGGTEDQEVRTTPMRGTGKRRASNPAEYGPAAGVATAFAESSAAAALREGGIRRKPVPSTVMEGTEDSYPRSDEDIDPTNATSSVARGFERDGQSPPTPGVDDTPYIRFALDQLTRDEEVRGSRRYRGLGSGVDGNYPYLMPGAFPTQTGEQATQVLPPPQPVQQREPGFQRPTVPPEWQQPRHQSSGGFRSTTPGAAAAAGALLPYELQQRDEQKARFEPDEPPPRNPQRLSQPAIYPAPPLQMSRQQQPQGLSELPDEDSLHRASAQLQKRPGSGDSQNRDTRFLPVSSDNDGRHQPLTFVPGILRPVRLFLFILALLAFIACLLFCAIYSLVHTGLANYGRFGDGRYFIFEYLPTLLGMILFFWTLQLEMAVYRIAPFVAMSSLSPREREAGARLPLVPKGFVLPFFGHFGARQSVVGFFVVVAWLQIWTIPLLASSFNVYYFGSPATGRWRWIATQGAIWAVIILYLLLLIATVVLMIWLEFSRRVTGLKWDPRSFADLVVLLERSNALVGSEGNEPPVLGYWRTNARANEVFHTYGISEKEARRYSLEDGRIREKGPAPASRDGERGIQMPISRFSTDPAEAESGEQRHSREKMLPKPTGSDDDSDGHRHSGPLPWFLHPLWAALWAIIAIVLLLAFLIVSYLPSTRVRNGFEPDVPAPVNTLGFSGTNFLYSFVPALLGMLCLLFWLDIDYAYRRMAVLEALAKEDGELAERSLLLSYPAEFPGVVTMTALVNGNFKVAFLSFMSLIAATLPILGGGVFWAQFIISAQRTRISAHMPAYYALTFFCVLYALSYLLIFPGRRLRHTNQQLAGNGFISFADALNLVRESRMLDDVAFHGPASKTDLVTRLLSAPPGSRISAQQEEGMQSKLSLADSVRGFGKARQAALGGLGIRGVPRYGAGRFSGRGGGDFVGVDRVGR